MKFSIITVTYNCEDLIETTLNSVLIQDFLNFEYIIVDGGSTDNTLKIIESYKDKIDIIISEPDKGIYDAMNKAIKLASGEYINFMNAGDTFIGNNIITTINNFLNQNNCSLAYGYARTSYLNKELLIGNSDASKIKICHQAAFYKKDLHHKYGLYDLNYKIVSDRDFFAKLYTHHEPICFVNTIIVDYMYDGLTTKNVLARIYEDYMLDQQYFSEKKLLNFFKFLTKSIFYKLKGFA